jgi:aminoglycoside 2''-phosphotransferase
MAVDANDLLKRAQALMPELSIEQFEVNEDGLINDVAIVNRKYVFRFVKDEQSARILAMELKILDLIRPHLKLNVPTPIFTSADAVIYPYLEGQPLLRETLIKLDSLSQQDIANQIGEFLHSLHHLKIAGLGWEVQPTRAPVKREDWVDKRQRLQQKMYPLMMIYQVRWVESLFETALEDPDYFRYEPALIHGDLAPYHFLFDPYDHKINGVIDFGMAGAGDPASDIGILISCYGESFVSKIGNVYPELEKYLPRARFYALGIELEWILNGLETGQAFWFTAHIGGPRDIRE